MRTPLVLGLALVANSGCFEQPAASDEVGESGTDGSDTEATSSEAESETTGGGDTYSLDTCETNIADDVAPFYTRYFACSTITNVAAGTEVATLGLPPHLSPYYPADDPNYVEFDDRGGTHHKNPNELAAGDFQIVIPDAPVAKGITIDAGMVDNAMGTSGDEYNGGPIGVALDGVVIFAAMAAMGDDIAEEQFTFDLYEAHPAGTAYHYHFNSPGPLEVMVDRGYSDDSTPGFGAIELYGILCDGTLVLGCTELDGSAPASGDFDAQNGHVHDVSDGDTTHFADRYHTHVCPGQWPAYPYFPEIAYYEITTCPAMGPP